MIIESLDLVARRDGRRELHTALNYLMGPTQVEAGCVVCRLYQNTAEPNSFRFECVWETRADLIRHLKSENYKQFLILMESSVEPPCVQFRTISETEGLELVYMARQQKPDERADPIFQS